MGKGTVQCKTAGCENEITPQVANRNHGLCTPCFEEKLRMIARGIAARRRRK